MQQLERSVWWSLSDSVARDEIAQTESFIKKRYDRITGTNRMFSTIGGYHNAISLYHWILGDWAASVDQRRIGAWYAHWWFRLHQMGVDEWVELPLIGTDLMVVMHGRDDAKGASESDLIRALLLNDSTFVELLLGWERPGWDARPDGLRWKIARRRLWWSFFGGDPGVAEVLKSAENELGWVPDGDPLPFGGSWKQKYLTEYALIRSVVENSQMMFDAAIVAAHDHHVAFYSSPTPDGGLNSGNPSVALDSTKSVIVNHGVRQGLALNVQSPYFVDLTPLLNDLGPVAPGYEPA